MAEQLGGSRGRNGSAMSTPLGLSRRGDGEAGVGGAGGRSRAGQGGARRQYKAEQQQAAAGAAAQLGRLAGSSVCMLLCGCTRGRVPGPACTLRGVRPPAGDTLPRWGSPSQRCSAPPAPAAPCLCGLGSSAQQTAPPRRCTPSQPRPHTHPAGGMLSATGGMGQMGGLGNRGAMTARPGMGGGVGQMGGMYGKGALTVQRSSARTMAPCTHASAACTFAHTRTLTCTMCAPLCPRQPPLQCPARAPPAQQGPRQHLPGCTGAWDVACHAASCAPRVCVRPAVLLRVTHMPLRCAPCTACTACCMCLGAPCLLMQ